MRVKVDQTSPISSSLDHILAALCSAFAACSAQAQQQSDTFATTFSFTNFADRHGDPGEYYLSGAFRGTGFELATDAYGAIRSQKGLYISTFGRPGASGAAPATASPGVTRGGFGSTGAGHGAGE